MQKCHHGEIFGHRNIINSINAKNKIFLKFTEELESYFLRTILLKYLTPANIFK